MDTKRLAKEAEEGADEVDDDGPEDDEDAADGDGSLGDFVFGGCFWVWCAVAGAKVSAHSDTITPFT